MTIEQLQEIAKELPGLTYDIKWDSHLCFNVGCKMFLVTAPENVPVTASIKVSDEDFEMLTQREGIVPAPYLARYKWVFIDNITRFNQKEWEHYLTQAYELVFAKLPAKIRKQIAGTNV
jgi:predicted DNA-binding protein (MmcQ/YjbR family)